MRTMLVSTQLKIMFPPFQNLWVTQRSVGVEVSDTCSPPPIIRWTIYGLSLMWAIIIGLDEYIKRVFLGFYCFGSYIIFDSSHFVIIIIVCFVSSFSVWDFKKSWSWKSIQDINAYILTHFNFWPFND